MTNERLLLTDTFETWAKKFNSAMDNIETAIENVPAIETLAPKNHASEENVYGVGNASLYGHLKISDSVSSPSDSTGGIAASPKAIKTAYDKGVTALNTANNAMTKANDAMTKATTVFTGSTPGLVPEATSSDARKTLLGNGTWGVIEGDAAKMTLSSDLQLTADSPRSIVLTTTTTGLSVRLPNPSTLPRGAVFHLFVNASEDIQLCNFSGQPFKAHPVLSEYTAIRIQLIDATAGLWALANYNKIDMSDAPAPLGTLSLSDQIIVNGGTDRGYRTKMHVLSENSAIIVYTTGTRNRVVILSITGTDIVVGDIYEIYNLSDFSQCGIAKLSANKVLVSIADENKYIYAMVITISGTTVTIGKFTQITTSKVSDKFNLRSVALSANKVLLFYLTSDNNTHYDILSSSDTNEVVKLKVRTGGNNQNDMVAVSENTIFGIYAGSSPQTIFKINIAEDNTITFNDVLRIYIPVMNTVSMTAISEEKFLIAYSNANYAGCVKVVTLNDSGPELICTTSTTRVENSSVTSLSKKTAVVCFYGPNYYNEVYALRINQNTITVTDKKILSGKITYGLDVSRLSSNHALLTYHNNFIQGSTSYDKIIARTITLL